MRIMFIGNFKPEHSTESDLLKTLRIMGHDVLPIQEDALPRDLPPVGTRLGFYLDAGETRPLHDVVLWCHTHGWRFFEDETLVRKDIPTVAFTLDLFRGLARHDPKYVETHPWFKCRYFFQPDDPAWLRERGVNAFLSPPGVLETSCYVAAPDPLHPAFDKIAFVGSREYHPEWPWRQELLTYLADTYGDDFMLFEHSSGMRGHALNVLYASAAVVVGDSCFASPTSPYTSDRLFETLGRGGNLVYPRVNVCAFGPDGSEDAFDLVHWYEPGDFESLGIAIDDALGAARESARDVYRSHQIRAIRRHHTYRSRLESIFETLAQHEPSIAEALSR